MKRERVLTQTPYLRIIAYKETVSQTQEQWTDRESCVSLALGAR